MKPDRLLARLARGEFGNVAFSDLQRLLTALGFELLRVRSSHHIFGHRQFSDLVNIQEVAGQVKPYQLRQVMRLVERYHLSLEDGRE